VSIRLRLTLWQTALLALVLTAFAVVVYLVVARQETSRLDATLSLHAEDVRSVFIDQGPGSREDGPPRNAVGARPAGRGDEDDRGWHGPGGIETPSPDLNRVIAATLDDESLVAQIVDPRGRQLAWSAYADQPAPPPTIPDDALRSTLLAGRQVRETMTIAGEERRVYADNGPTRGDASVAVIVTSSLRPLQDTLARWRLLLVAAVLGATALSAAIGWFLAAQAMRPVDRMTRAAAAIGHSADLSRRLPEPPQHDELGRLARTFNEMLGDLGEAFATQRRFLADASHELRTPLTVVRANLDALRRGAGADPAEREETLRATAREADRMARLVADLLALARADAGQPLARQRLALDTLVLDVYQQGRAIADGVHLELGEWEQIAVDGDPDRLKQVALNLLDNALRHTPAGGAVTLDLLRLGDEAVLRVRDTGPGIDPEHLPRIFERFYRADQPRSRQAGGTGLGLAIAREVAEAHGGRIDVASRPGAGSTFSLVLPVAATPTVAPAPAPRVVVESPAQTLTTS